jgi:hypothetical protein
MKKFTLIYTNSILLTGRFVGGHISTDNMMGGAELKGQEYK